MSEDTYARAPASTGQPSCWLFTYGLLRDGATFQHVLGIVPPGGVPARLRGYARLTSPNGYYYLVPDAAAPPVSGVLWQVTDAELARLDEFEDTDPADPTSPRGEYRRVWERAETADGAVACWVYVGGTLASGAPSSPRGA